MLGPSSSPRYGECGRLEFLGSGEKKQFSTFTRLRLRSGSPSPTGHSRQVPSVAWLHPPHGRMRTRSECEARALREGQSRRDERRGPSRPTPRPPTRPCHAGEQMTLSSKRLVSSTCSHEPPETQEDHACRALCSQARASGSPTPHAVARCPGCLAHADPHPPSTPAGPGGHSACLPPSQTRLTWRLTLSTARLGPPGLLRRPASTCRSRPSVSVWLT